MHKKKRVAAYQIRQDNFIYKSFFIKLSALSDGFVGAEIEQAVITALYEAFFNQRSLCMEDLEFAIKGTVPLSVTQKEEIFALRAWANVRAVSATPRGDLAPYKAEEPSETDVNTQRGGRMLDF